MLPVVVGSQRAGRIVFASTLLLAGTSVLPVWFGAGPVYLIGALSGGGYFVCKSWVLTRAPSRKNAMASFFASLVQLSLVLLAASLDAVLH